MSYWIRSMKLINKRYIFYFNKILIIFNINLDYVIVFNAIVDYANVIIIKEVFLFYIESHKMKF